MVDKGDKIIISRITRTTKGHPELRIADRRCVGLQEDVRTAPRHLASTIGIYLALQQFTGSHGQINNQRTLGTNINVKIEVLEIVMPYLCI